MKDRAELQSADGHRVNKKVLLATDLSGSGGVRRAQSGVCMERWGQVGDRVHLHHGAFV